MLPKLLVGADPEVFVRSGKEFISAHNMIAGTKVDPFPVQYGAVQVDGMALEYNIDPAESETQFVFNNRAVLTQLRSMIPTTYNIEISPVAEFSEEYMKNQPEEAKKLGCDPDFNAYAADINPAPDQHPTMRTAAGHIHLGWAGDQLFDPNDMAHFESCCILAKQMDFWLGLPSVVLDTDTKRKQMYGKAGCFRPKRYGMEYRVLSNFWLVDDDIMRLIYRNAKAGFEALVRGDNLSEQYGDICQKIINTNDKTRAINLCNSIGIPYKPTNWEQFKL